MKNRILKLELNDDNFDYFDYKKQEFEYYKFDANDSATALWREPSVGSGKGSKIYSRFFFGTDVYALSLESWNEDYQLTKLSLYYDRKNGLLRLDSARGNEKLIYNVRTKSTYLLKDGICSWKLDSTVHPSQDIQHLLGLLGNIEDMNPSYLYLGQQQVQETICDVYEKMKADLETSDRDVTVIYVKKVG